MAQEHVLNLTPEALRSLERKWLGQIEAPRNWRPRVPVASQLTEALEIASVMDEAGTSDLLPASASVQLRELCLVARSLHHRSLSLRADRGETRHAAATKAATHAWFGEAFQTLRFLAEFNEDSHLKAQLEAIRSEGASEDGLALAIHPVATLFERNAQALERLGFGPEFSSRGLSLSQELLELSSRRAAHLQQRRDATSFRDTLLYEIRERVKRYRATLSYVHRNNPDLLRRIASPYNRKKRAAENARRRNGPAQKAVGSR